MIKIVGTSKVDVNLLALEQLLNNILPDGFTDEMEIKMDARGNVKSTFMKIDSGSVAKCSIYTGAIETEWDVQFVSTDNVKTQLEALIFISAFAVKKFLAKVKYDMKLANMSNTRVEEDFSEIKSLICALTEKYNEIVPTVQGSVSSSSSPKPASSKAKAPTNPNAGVPLEGTPQVDIPEDLDLVGGTAGLMPTSEEQIAVNDAEALAQTEVQADVEESASNSEVTETAEEIPVTEDASVNDEETLDLDSAIQETAEGTVPEQATETAEPTAEGEDVENDEPLI